MAMLSDQIKEQLRQRFAERLVGPVQLRLLTRPGSGRLILPGGLGCPTCDEAKALAEDLAAAAPEQISLEVVDVSTGGPWEGRPVPTLEVGPPGETSRIAWQGLPGGYEFATVVDAIERVSRSELGLSQETLNQLARLDGLDQAVEIMVFATPT